MISNKIPTLHYFNGRGRGETIRLLLTLAGVEFNDVRHDFPLKDDVRKITPFGQLPYYIDDSIEIAQSVAIESYIANKYGLVGENPIENAKILAIANAAIDVISPTFSNDTEEKKVTYNTQTLPRLLSSLEKILLANGGKHVVGNKTNWADANLYYLVEYLHYKGLSDIVDRYPTLNHFRSEFEKIPSISIYVKNRPAGNF